MALKNSPINNGDQAIGEYIQSTYVGHEAYMPDHEYSKMIDSIVFACVDIAPFIGDKVLLINRLYEPQIGLWLVGGRIKTGEQLKQTTRRLIEEEVGLVISEQRFEYLCTYVAAWEKRRQEPIDNGVHTVSLVFKVELTENEVENIQLNKDHDQYELIDIKEILNKPDAYHPALVQCIKALN